MERDTARQGRQHSAGDFNSHAHVERDHKLGYPPLCKSISTHTLTWSVTGASPHMERQATHFNSHAHVERDFLLYGKIKYTLGISTHTLTWSVTLYFRTDKEFPQNFNSHAHVERDDQTGRGVIITNGFQLTRSRGA